MKSIIADLDETVFFTDKQIRLNMFHYINQKTTLSWQDKLFLKVSNTAHTTVLATTEELKEENPDLGKEFNDYIFLHGLHFDEFMLLVKPDMAMVNLLKEVQAIEDVNLYVCTHRAFSDNGERYTLSSLANHCPDLVFTDVFVIKSEEHPNKVDFLKQKINNPFLLLDDNPVGGFELLQPIPEILVWEQNHSFNKYYLQNRARNIETLRTKVLEFIKAE